MSRELVGTLLIRARKRDVQSFLREYEGLQELGLGHGNGYVASKRGSDTDSIWFPTCRHRVLCSIVFRNLTASEPPRDFWKTREEKPFVEKGMSANFAIFLVLGMTEKVFLSWHVLRSNWYRDGVTSFHAISYVTIYWVSSLPPII